MSRTRKTFDMLYFINRLEYEQFREDLKANKEGLRFKHRIYVSLVAAKDSNYITLLSSKNWALFAIKRASDNKIFRLGDTVPSLGSRSRPMFITYMKPYYNNVRFFNNGVYFQTLKAISHSYGTCKINKLYNLKK